MPTYEKAPREVNDLIRRVIKAHHDALRLRFARDGRCTAIPSGRSRSRPDGTTMSAGASDWGQSGGACIGVAASAWATVTRVAAIARPVFWDQSCPSSVWL